MEIVESPQINSFAPVVSNRNRSDLIGSDQNEPPTEDAVFVLTSVQLRSLISGAVQDAIRSVQVEIDRLRADRDQDRAEFDRFKATHKRFAIQTGKDIDALFEANLTTTAKPETNKKTTDHIDELHRLMNEEKSHQVSIAKAARLLGISKERTRQLKPLILQDGRFEMGWGQIKGKKAVVIRIRKFL